MQVEKSKVWIKVEDISRIRKDCIFKTIHICLLCKNNRVADDQNLICSEIVEHYKILLNYY